MKDWTACCRDQLINNGFRLTNSASDTDIQQQYLNQRKRLVDPRPREIYRTPTFLCPKEHEEGLHLLEQEVTKGASLTPRLSRKINKAAEKDPMLFVWGIHHFHLGVKKDKKYLDMMDGTKELLFAWVTDTQFFEIGVYTHQDWSRQSLLQSVYDVWSHLLEPYRLKGILGTPGDRTNDEICRLWKSGISTPFTADDGSVFAPPGGGITTAKTSTGVQFELMDCRGIIRSIEKSVHDNRELYLSHFLKQDQSTHTDLVLRMRVLPEGFEIYSDEYRHVRFIYFRDGNGYSLAIRAVTK